MTDLKRWAWTQYMFLLVRLSFLFATKDTHSWRHRICEALLARSGDIQYRKLEPDNG